MENNMSKGTLAVILSKLTPFPNAKVREEQYTTDSEITAELLTQGAILGDFTDKIVVDLGAGTGILGLGTLLLGAKKVIFTDKDPSALEIAQQNYQTLKNEFTLGTATFECKNITEFAHKADTVIQNPPFGTRKEHADKTFLEKAFATAPIVYSFHKTITKQFIEAIAKEHDFTITHTFNYQFPLKNTLPFHTKKIHKIDVTAFRLQKVFK